MYLYNLQPTIVCWYHVPYLFGVDLTQNSSMYIVGIYERVDEFLHGYVLWQYHTIPY